MENISQAMFEISLDEDDEGGIALGDIGEGNPTEQQLIGDPKLCLVGKFLTEGVFDFTAMQHTLATLWKPGKGVYIKAVEANLFLFQFYHVIDLNRVIEGSPWSFNRKTLLIGRMNESMNPRCVSLDTIDLWVQVHDMQPGFMSERILQEIGSQVGRYICSCPSNFKGIWREYMRIRITIDITKPLRRRMKVRKAGNEWSWITFKYENVPTFCFICGIIGHADKFCSKLFDVPENEITRPFGACMRAQLRKQNNLIGSKWLRNGDEPTTDPANITEDKRNLGTEKGGQTKPSDPGNRARDNDYGKAGDNSGIDYGKSGNNVYEKAGDRSTQKEIISNTSEISNFTAKEVGGKNSTGGKSITLENKKRTDCNGAEIMGLNTEIEQTSENDNMDQDDNSTGSKNGYAAGPDNRARQEL